MIRARRGATLLEAIVAITLLATLGLTILQMTRSAMDAAEAADRSDRELRSASDFMNAVSLWSEGELDQRLGAREQGSWLLEISRPTPGFYRVTLLDSGATAVVLETALYRHRQAIRVD